jgi:hypothetical protein
MEAAGRWHGLATAGGVLAIVAGAAALTPGASASGTAHSCANKTETIEVKGEPGSAPTKFKETIKAISTEGVSCAAAYKFLGLQVRNTTQTTPEHYKCKTGHFKVPLGYVPMVCTHAGAKIKYGQQGG